MKSYRSVFVSASAGIGTYEDGQNCWYPLVNERKTHNDHRNNLNLIKVIM